MGPNRYLILQQIPISSLLDPSPVNEITDNSDSIDEIGLLPDDVRYEILYYFNIKEDEPTPRDGYSRKSNGYVEINFLTGDHYDPLLDTYVTETSGYSKRTNVGLSRTRFNKHRIGYQYNRSGFDDISKCKTMDTGPITIKMADLLPSLTDMLETPSNVSSSLYRETHKRKREEDTLENNQGRVAIKLPPISTLSMPYPDNHEFGKIMSNLIDLQERSRAIGKDRIDLFVFQENSTHNIDLSEK